MSAGFFFKETRFTEVKVTNRQFWVFFLGGGGGSRSSSVFSAPNCAPLHDSVWPKRENPPPSEQTHFEFRGRGVVFFLGGVIIHLSFCLPRKSPLCHPHSRPPPPPPPPRNKGETRSGEDTHCECPILWVGSVYSGPKQSSRVLSFSLGLQTKKRGRFKD